MFSAAIHFVQFPPSFNNTLHTMQRYANFLANSSYSAIYHWYFVMVQQKKVNK